jgi:hypothetical protein
MSESEIDSQASFKESVQDISANVLPKDEEKKGAEARPVDKTEDPKKQDAKKGGGGQGGDGFFKSIIRAILPKFLGDLLFGKEGAGGGEQDKGKKTLAGFFKNLFGLDEESQEVTKDAALQNSQGLQKANLGPEERQRLTELAQEFVRQSPEVFKGPASETLSNFSEDIKRVKDGAEKMSPEEEAVKKFLEGIKERAGEDKDKQSVLLDQASKLVAESKNPDLIKQWEGAVKSVGDKNPELKEVAGELSGKIGEKIETQSPMKAALEEARSGGVVDTLREGGSKEGQSTDAVVPAKVAARQSEGRG